MEWIYRGSTRLGPLFTEMEQQKLRQQQAVADTQAGMRIRRSNMPTKKKNAPYIEYKQDVRLLTKIHCTLLIPFEGGRI